MMPRRLRGLLLACLVTQPLSAQDTGGALAPEVEAALAALGSADVDAEDAATRRKLFRRVFAEPAAWRDLAEAIDRKLVALERGYADLLDEPVREAYHDRLRSLSTEELREVARVRRVWRPYVLTPTTQLHFQEHFLMPATRVRELLLPDVAELQTRESSEQLRRMREFAGYRTEVREALGLGEDPTTGEQAPTGIPMPPLQRVRTYDEHLDHLDRTIAVASAVAPPGARDILLDNAAKARQIDLEEAEFVLYANEVRALMGVVCWSTDVLACAATRDHSKDRVDGKAKGHWSSIPGKEGFTHRLRRFGTSGTSEGAGGGADGRGYLRALSYGGGHTGPLYSMKRNRVGVGRHGNCYTSVYGVSKNLFHPCHASTGELFLPPGLGLDDIEERSLQDVYHALLFENYVGARQLLDAAKAPSKMDRFVREWFDVAIDAEADWLLERVARIAAVGDLHGVQLVIDEARAKFGDSLDKRLRSFEKKLQTRDGARMVELGRAYADACAQKDTAAIEALVRDHPATVYASAAQHYLAGDGKEAHPRGWFLERDPYLARFEYLVQR